MKTLNLMLSLVIFTCLAACSKKETTTPATTSAFTERGFSFKVPTGSGNSQWTSSSSSNSNSLGVVGYTSDNKRAIVSVSFHGTSKPTAGTYQIVDGAAGPMAANQASVGVLDSLDVSKQGFLLSDATSATATVAVDGSGKLTVTLSSTQISGNNNDYTNPSSVVSTHVVSTISGTIKEQ